MRIILPKSMKKHLTIIFLIVLSINYTYAQDYGILSMEMYPSGNNGPITSNDTIEIYYDLQYTESPCDPLSRTYTIAKDSIFINLLHGDSKNQGGNFSFCRCKSYIRINPLPKGNYILVSYMNHRFRNDKGKDTIATVDTSYTNLTIKQGLSTSISNEKVDPDFRYDVNSGYVFIENATAQTLSIFDLMGRKIIETTINEQQTSVPVLLTTGIYILKLTDKRGSQWIKKIYVSSF